MKEEWRDLKNTNYQVSSKGRVRRLTYLCPRSTGGYSTITLRIGTKMRHLQVHRLVAETFVGPIPKSKQVNHKNCVKTDNKPSNLEYVTRKENVAHAVMAGRYLRGEKHYRAKLNKKQVLSLRRIAATKKLTFTELGNLFGISKSTANKIARGQGYV